MTDQHPITPPPELVGQWRHQWWSVDPDCENTDLQHYIATQAAQWAADQELEACLEHLSRRGFSDADILGLRAARRPKPPSEADQALEALNQMDKPLGVVTASRASIIRRALERLKELEAAND